MIFYEFCKSLLKASLEPKKETVPTSEKEKQRLKMLYDAVRFVVVDCNFMEHLAYDFQLNVSSEKELVIILKQVLLLDGKPLQLWYVYAVCKLYAIYDSPEQYTLYNDFRTKL